MEIVDAVLTVILMVASIVFCIWAKNDNIRVYQIPYSADTVRTILHNYSDERSNLYLELKGDKLICSQDYRDDILFKINLYENNDGTRAELKLITMFTRGYIIGSRPKYTMKKLDRVFINLGAKDITRY